MNPPLGCAYPGCQASGESRPSPVAGRVGECPTCKRLMIACPAKGCEAIGTEAIGTYNLPFARYCRRCGLELEQAPAWWDEARQDGWWDVVLWPTDPAELARFEPVGHAEVVADLSRLDDSAEAPPYPIAMAMIRGSLAVHRAGRYLALTRAAPFDEGRSPLWVEKRDPFPRPPDGSPPTPYTPALLPDARHLLFSGPQGLLALDLWSCHGLSAKDDEPRRRIIRCHRRSIVAAPIPLGEGRVGLVTRGPDSAEFRWSVWDLAAQDRDDDRFSARLDTEESPELPIRGKSCRVDVVDGRILAFTTGREHWAWRIDDAARSIITDQIIPTWPKPGPDSGESIAPDRLETRRPSRPAFLVTPGLRKFSWFFQVQRDDPTDPEPIRRYAVDFGSLQPDFAQPVSALPSGARPIGSAPDRDGKLQMYFLAEGQIYDGVSASIHMSGLPRTIKGEPQLRGPLVLSVGDKGNGERWVQIDSLRDRKKIADIPIGDRDRGDSDKLVSDPLLWSRWLFTIELDRDGRLLLRRRVVAFEKKP